MTSHVLLSYSSASQCGRDAIGTALPNILRFLSEETNGVPPRNGKRRRAEEHDIEKAVKANSRPWNIASPGIRDGKVPQLDLIPWSELPEGFWLICLLVITWLRRPPFPAGDLTAPPHVSVQESALQAHRACRRLRQLGSASPWALRRRLSHDVDTQRIADMTPSVYSVQPLAPTSSVGSSSSRASSSGSWPGWIDTLFTQ